MVPGCKSLSVLDSQRLRNELEAKLRSEQSDKQDLRRRIEEYLAGASRLRTRNQEHEMEMAKVEHHGKAEEISFETEVQTWTGICVSERLPRNGDYVLAFRDPSGAQVDPRLLVDN